MKTMTIIAAAAMVLAASLAFAQAPAPAGPSAKAATVGPNFVDANGDGICDNQGARKNRQAGRRMGPADGKGNKGVGPRDGTGYGAMSRSGRGTGTCPYGNSGRGRRGGRR